MRIRSAVAHHPVVTGVAGLLVAIPADVPLGEYPSAVVWCKRVSVAFGAAPVQ
jgi:Electron transfer DM13